MRSPSVLLLLLAGLGVVTVRGGRDPAECEVCIKALNDVAGRLRADEKKDLLKIEEKLGAYCAKPPGEKEARLCYYIDPIKREISQPFKNGVPVDRICERLKKKSAEVCSLRFASTTTPVVTDTTDLSKLRVKDLKKIMAEKGISCPECLEKADFVAKLESVLGKGGKAEL